MSRPAITTYKPAKVRFGLRFKFLLIISALLMLIVAGVALFLVRSTTNELRDNLRRETRSFVTLATTPIGNNFILYKDSGTSNIGQQAEAYANLDNVISNIRVVDLSGKVLYELRKGAPADISAGQAASFEPTYISGGGGTIERIIYPFFEASGAHRYSLVYDVSSQQINDQIQQQTRDVALLAAGALVITILATFVLIDITILRPVRNLSQQAAVISAGNLSQQIDASGHDEISRLGGAVNAMANMLKEQITKLQELDKTKSEFMMIASHNLRTPLTIINGYLEAVDNYQSADQLRKVIDRISASAKRLSVFSEDVLTISRFELGDEGLRGEESDLTRLVSAVAEEFKPIAIQQQRQFSQDIIHRPLAVHISQPHVRSAIWNLLDNALKFTPKDGVIKLSLNAEGGTAKITISDNGMGISKEELPKLFTKFHRGTSTLRYNYEGMGIGLYASMLIIRRYGGDIQVDSTEGQGSSFTICLPLGASVATETAPTVVA